MKTFSIIDVTDEVLDGKALIELTYLENVIKEAIKRRNKKKCTCPSFGSSLDCPRCGRQ